MARAALTGGAITVEGRQVTEPLYQTSVDAVDGIPARLSYTYKASQLHARTEQVRALGTSDVAQTIRYPVTPFGLSGFSIESPTPFVRTDYLTAGSWFTEVDLGALESDDGEPQDQPGTWRSLPYRAEAGEKSHDTWLTAPLLAAGNESENGDGVARRFGDDLYFNAQPWNDGQSDHTGYAWSMPGHWKLSSGGKTLGEGWDVYGDVELPAARTWYYLSVTGDLDGFPNVQRSRSVKVTWRFPSGHVDDTDEDGEAQPLLSLRVHQALDDHNRVESGAVSKVTVTAGAANHPVRLTSLRYEISSDGGKSWHRATVHRSGDGYRATVRQPHQTGPVSLRITAWAVGGLVVRQTISQAYAVT